MGQRTVPLCPYPSTRPCKQLPQRTDSQIALLQTRYILLALRDRQVLSLVKERSQLIRYQKGTPMRRFFAAAAFILLSALGLSAQTSTTTITIVAPASLGTITPTPSHFYQNTSAPISFASSTSGFNSSCTATAGTTTLIVTYSSTTLALSGTLTAAMTSGTAGSTLTITIACTPSPLTMNSPVVLPNAKAGTSYSASLLTVTGLAGGVPPYTWTLTSGSLPPGLSLSSNGVVAGVPSSSGSSTFGFTVTDSSGLALNFDPRQFDFLSFRTRNVAARLFS